MLRIQPRGLRSIVFIVTGEWDRYGLAPPQTLSSPFAPLALPDAVRISHLYNGPRAGRYPPVGDRGTVPAVPTSWGVGSSQIPGLIGKSGNYEGLTMRSRTCSTFLGNPNIQQRFNWLSPSRCQKHAHPRLHVHRQLLPTGSVQRTC